MVRCIHARHSRTGVPRAGRSSCAQGSGKVSSSLLGGLVRFWVVSALHRLAWLIALALTPSLARGSVDFHAEVRPIFEQHCYECHGPKEREGGFRLTNRDEAFAPGEFGVPVITESSADASLLVDLLSSDDPEERMPHERDPLRPEQIDRIRRWIDEGAVWPEDGGDHWAYRKPVRPSLPEVRRTDWLRGPLDRFVLARLEAEGLAPAAEADPATLLRRVHLDLTGLPPTPEQLEAFLADPSPAAYDRVVDGLLASPLLGERWASVWLDLGRYADSTGFMSEVELSNWPYRDWVIDAINGDMPFDQFTIEQIAGDLLPSSTLRQKTATGFHRSAPLNLEAGVREEDARIFQVVDRVNTTATVWLGTTLECAQCHDHKYDPFTQEDYYRVLAFLNNTPNEAVSQDGEGGVHLFPQGPTLELPHLPRTRARAEAISEQMLDSLDEALRMNLPGAMPLNGEERGAVLAAAGDMKTSQALARASQAATERLEQDDRSRTWWPWSNWWEPWLDEARDRLREGEPRWEPLRVVSFESRKEGVAVDDSYRILDDGSVLLEGPPPERVTYVVELSGGPRPLTGLRLETLRHESLPGGGPGRVNPYQPDFVVSEIDLAVSGPDGEVPVEFAAAHATSHWPGGSPNNVLDEDIDTGWAYVKKALGHDQSITLATQGAVDTTENLRLRIHQLKGGNRTIGRFRILATGSDPTLVALPDRLQERVRDAGWEGATDMERALLLTLARRSGLPSANPAFDRARLAFSQLPDPPVAHVMREEAPRTTHVFERGDHRTPGIEVSAGTPASLHPMDDRLPRTRLGFARWLVDPDNPLVARVATNRWWALLFGEGLVATPEDFGVRGDRPSHPDLLDWLAVEFVEGGWSRKNILRQIVTSATYRQSAVPRDLASLEADPGNRLLSRNPPLRLPAETIRDNALFIAGLLSPTMGGPAVRPPQPPGVWRSNGATRARYVPSQGEDLYRRGVYTVWRRTAPYPSFVNFDAGDRTACAVRRRGTNTPLQALTLLNDEVYVEAALAFADRVLRERADAPFADRIRYAYHVALARDPSPTEIAVLRTLHERGRERARKDKDEVDELLEGVARFEPSPQVDRRELAAWFPIARVLLNLDETVNRA